MQLLNDIIFKNIMDSEEGKEFLSKIINHAIGVKIKKEDIEFFNPILKKDNITVKGKTVDLFIKSKGLRIFIEANNYMDDKIRKRNAMYIMNYYVNDVKVKDKYNKNIKYYQINLTRNSYSKELKDEYGFYNIKREYNYVPDLIIYEYDLEKIKKDLYNGKCKGEIYILLASLVAKKEELEEMSKKNKLVQRLKENMEYFTHVSENYKEFIPIEEDLKFLNEEAIKIERKEGMQEGKKLGRKEGIEIGKKEGMELGKKEGIELGKKEGIELGKKKGMEQGFNIGQKQGIMLGEQQGKIELMSALIEKGILSVKELSNALNVNPEEIEAILQLK